MCRICVERLQERIKYYCKKNIFFSHFLNLVFVMLAHVFCIRLKLYSCRHDSKILFLFIKIFYSQSVTLNY